MRRRVVIAGLAAAAITALPALADEQAGCAGFKWHIDREQTAFAGQGLPVINAGAEIPGVMEPAVLKLAKQDGQTFEIPSPHKPRHDPAYAGVFPMMFMQVSGPYDITISDDAWVDVIQNGKVLKPSAYTASRGCHDVRKSVQFMFEKGPSTIMVTDAPTDTLKLEVLPPPPDLPQ